MSDPIAMVQAFAELRYGVVAHTLENSMKYGHNLGHTPYGNLRYSVSVSRPAFYHLSALRSPADSLIPGYHLYNPLVTVPHTP